MDQVLCWVANHWKALSIPGVITIGGAIGGALMWFPKYRLTRLEKERVETERQDRGIAQVVCLWADAVQLAEFQKGRAGRRSFSEEEIREALPPQMRLRLHAALELMRKDGRACRADQPSQWFLSGGVK